MNGPGQDRPNRAEPSRAGPDRQRVGQAAGPLGWPFVWAYMNERNERRSAGKQVEVS